MPTSAYSLEQPIEQPSEQSFEKIEDAANIESTENTPAFLGKTILLAAMAISGIAGLTPTVVQAEDAPEKAEISFKYLRYRESQPGLERVSVNSPVLGFSVPIAGVWSVDGSVVSDQVSGASPRYHTVISSASKMSDSRRAADVKVVRYFERVKLAAGIAYSTEHDYDSKAVSLSASFASEDNNSTWNFGVGAASDKITATGKKLQDARRGTDFLIGLTQVISPQDIAQLSLTHTTGSGYFSDAYKSLDIRPRERQQTALLLRHNHHFTQTDGSLRLSYRYYKDSFAIRSHTLGAEYAQPLADGWTITPSVRLYSQTAANFYFDPVYAFLYLPLDYKIGVTKFVSEDQRLSAFGGRTFGLKLSKKIDQSWTVDVSMERMEQRSEWAFFNNTRPALAPLTAHIIQLGISHSF